LLAPQRVARCLQFVLCLAVCVCVRMDRPCPPCRDVNNCEGIDTQCIVWTANLSMPVFAPPRVTHLLANNSAWREALWAHGVPLSSPPPSPFPSCALLAAQLSDGIVLVSTTSAEADTNGTLYALNATDGNIIWTLPAEDVVTQQTVGLHYVPAIDDTYDPCAVWGRRPVHVFPAAILTEGGGVLRVAVRVLLCRRLGVGYIGYGRSLIAFSLDSGDILSSFYITSVDAFASR